MRTETPGQQPIDSPQGGSASQRAGKHRVVIVGGGFGGLYAAKAFRRAPVDVTLIDKRNFHLFQPLLYQVATGSLSPADISSPLRSILSRQKNTRVLLEEVIDIDPDRQVVIMPGMEQPYDTLIIATGAGHSYFGNDQWQDVAPGLKTVEDALEIRRKIFMAFEAAEKETDPARRQAWLNFVVVGAGPTGVEMAGAIAELAHKTLKNDFRHIDPSEAQIILLEGVDRVLPPYPSDLSHRAAASLQKLGVTVRTKTLVTQIDDNGVTAKQGDAIEQIPTKTVLWAAGVKASKLGAVLQSRTGALLDRAGRVIVEPDLTVPNYSNIFVIGDLAHFAHQEDGKPLPGVAPVAMQQGQYVARLVWQRMHQLALPPFSYSDFGSMAVIGQNEAVVNLGFIKFSGILAWLFWVFAHIYYLIEFDSKLVVMFQWGWSYFTRKRGARLITGEADLFQVGIDAEGKFHVPEHQREPQNTPVNA